MKKFYLILDDQETALYEKVKEFLEKTYKIKMTMKNVFVTGLVAFTELVSKDETENQKEKN